MLRQSRPAEEEEGDGEEEEEVEEEDGADVSKVLEHEGQVTTPRLPAEADGGACKLLRMKQGIIHSIGRRRWMQIKASSIQARCCK